MANRIVVTYLAAIDSHLHFVDRNRQLYGIYEGTLHYLFRQVLIVNNPSQQQPIMSDRYNNSHIRTQPIYTQIRVDRMIVAADSWSVCIMSLPKGQCVPSIPTQLEMKAKS